MSTDPILEEVHAMKDAAARRVNYDVHALCERARQHEKRHPDRLATRRIRQPRAGAPSKGEQRQ